MDILKHYVTVDLGDGKMVKVEYPLGNPKRLLNRS
jgi:major membrane immunogen (membrane-anchored lipoprotein)